VKNNNINGGMESFKTFANKLKERLTQPLPGQNAQVRMASQIRLKEFKFEYDTRTAFPGGVLVLLYPHENSIRTVFILRQTYDGVHSGQVSFPGGRREGSDRSIIDTALRESFEEVNINPSKVEIIGKLSEMYIPPSNFLVTPVVGYTISRPDFKPDPTEVAEIIEAEIDFLFDDDLRKEKILNVRGTEIYAPCFELNGYTIWGATAMILSEFKEAIQDILES
jgi:8-oxo-dGTP pyrophosphatase MutT (NUDIX family)